ncbi:MAG: hypothetical protein ABH811_00960 [archaeon]
MIQGIETYIYEVEKYENGSFKKLEPISFTTNNPDKLYFLIKAHSGHRNVRDECMLIDGFNYEVRSLGDHLEYLIKYNLKEKIICGGISLFD